MSTAIPLTPLTGLWTRKDATHIVFEEEEGEGAGDYGSWSKQPVEEQDGLLENLSLEQRQLIQRYDKRARTFSGRARTQRIWYLALSIASICSATLIPVAIAVDWQVWIPALLGAVSASIQGSQQVMQLDAKSLATHATLVRISLARDRLSIAVRTAATTTDIRTNVELYERELLDAYAALGSRVVELDSSKSS